MGCCQSKIFSCFSKRGHNFLQQSRRSIHYYHIPQRKCHQRQDCRLKNNFIQTQFSCPQNFTQYCYPQRQYFNYQNCGGNHGNAFSKTKPYSDLCYGKIQSLPQYQPQYFPQTQCSQVQTYLPVPSLYPEHHRPISQQYMFADRSECSFDQTECNIENHDGRASFAKGNDSAYYEKGKCAK